MSRRPARAAGRSLALGSALLLAATLATAAPTSFTARDLNTLARVSDPQVSPDGRYVVFTQRETDLEANRGRTDLWLLELPTAAARAPGSPPSPRPLTRHPAADGSGRWAADGAGVFFLSSRSGSSQVWYIGLAGGEAQQVTDLPLDVGSFEVSPRGDRLALSLEVFADCADLQCTVERKAAQAGSKASGRGYDELFVRHWDSWRDGTLATLFTVPLDRDRRAGAPVNVSGKVRGHVPSKPFGGDEDYAFSPDGARLVFSARLAERSEPWSTNFDLYEVPADGTAAPRNLTADNPAWDAQPVFLANGDLAWLAMSRPGFEADRYVVKLRSARDGQIRALTAEWDRSVTTLLATHDRRRLLGIADDLGQTALFEIDPASGRRSTLVGDGQVQAAAATPRGAVVAWAALDSPPDLHVVTAGTRTRLTAVNASRLAGRQLAAFEQFTFAGADEQTVYGYVMKPHGWRAGQRYPLAFIVHGGPQVSFANHWSWRWNPQVYAGAGYGVVFIDFHGSPGYGQAFTDSISRDWGGKPLIDLQKGLDAALAKYEWLDGSRACSLGASYGGFMQNWIAGQWPDRFRCLVNHAGIFDNRTMYYTTEELWFAEWDHGGPYYEAAPIHEKFNPANHVTNWRTPMLVTHGALDYRVPYAQGLATFTALQRRGIESRFVFYPDENHWILKPANSIQWHGEVLDWLAKHLGQADSP